MTFCPVLYILIAQEEVVHAMQETSSKQVVEVIFDSTYRCNARCSYCDIPKVARTLHKGEEEIPVGDIREMLKSKYFASLSRFFISGGAPAIDVLVNLQYFRLHGGPYGGAPEPTYELLERLSVPVLIGFHLYSTEIEEWRSSTKVNPLEMVLGAVLPELDGCIEPIMVSGLASLGKDESIEGEVKEGRSIPERAAKLVDRALGWMNLREKVNSDKKVAILLYDYPLGRRTSGLAGYLDSLASLEIFLKKLAENGYRVEMPPGRLSEVLLSEQGTKNRLPE